MNNFLTKLAMIMLCVVAFFGSLLMLGLTVFLCYVFTEPTLTLTAKMLVTFGWVLVSMTYIPLLKDTIDIVFGPE